MRGQSMGCFDPGIMLIHINSSPVYQINERKYDSTFSRISTLLKIVQTLYNKGDMNKKKCSINNFKFKSLRPKGNHFS